MRINHGSRHILKILDIDTLILCKRAHIALLKLMCEILFWESTAFLPPFSAQWWPRKVKFMSKTTHKYCLINPAASDNLEEDGPKTCATPILCSIIIWVSANMFSSNWSAKVDVGSWKHQQMKNLDSAEFKYGLLEDWPSLAATIILLCANILYQWSIGA